MSPSAFHRSLVPRFFNVVRALHDLHPPPWPAPAPLGHLLHLRRTVQAQSIAIVARILATHCFPHFGMSSGSGKKTNSLGLAAHASTVWFPSKERHHRCLQSRAGGPSLPRLALKSEKALSLSRTQSLPQAQSSHQGIRLVAFRQLLFRFSLTFLGVISLLKNLSKGLLILVPDLGHSFDHYCVSVCGLGKGLPFLTTTENPSPNLPTVSTGTSWSP